MRKRILSLALCFALVLSLLPTGAFAADTSEWIEVDGIEGGKILFDASTGTIVDCEETVTSADIPGEIQGVTVTSIGDNAFSWCRSLSSVSIGNGVTSIGHWAFYWCKRLEHIFVDPTNSSYCSDEGGVLFNKSKTELIQCPVGNARTSYSIPDSVTSIGNEAFSWCSNLSSVSIGDSVTSIGYQAFYGCSSLNSVNIPGSVTSIGNEAFFRCSSLSSVSI